MTETIVFDTCRIRETLDDLARPMPDDPKLAVQRSDVNIEMIAFMQQSVDRLVAAGAPIPPGVEAYGIIVPPRAPVEPWIWDCSVTGCQYTSTEAFWHCKCGDHHTRNYVLCDS